MTALLPHAPAPKRDELAGIRYAVAYLRLLASLCPPNAMGEIRAREYKHAAAQLAAECEDAERLDLSLPTADEAPEEVLDGGRRRYEDTKG